MGRALKHCQSWGTSEHALCLRKSLEIKPSIFGGRTEDSPTQDLLPLGDGRDCNTGLPDLAIKIELNLSFTGKIKKFVNMSSPSGRQLYLVP